jgi:hypothetical protein
MEYFYVEQDQIKIPMYESIAKSYKYAKKLSEDSWRLVHPMI